MTFDFCGSGMSDGEYVSLGVYEKDDLAAVIEHLRQAGTTSTIALWGRSMGAAAALLHGERDPSIAAMVLDSAYSDLTALAEEMVEKGRQQGMFAPGILVRLVLSFIKSSIQKSANFDIKDVSPIRCANKSFIPALFVAARGDDFVAPHHSKNICDLYAGDKNLIMVDGDHNSNRPYFLYTSAAIFLTNTLQVPESWSLPDSQKYIGGLKPWDFVGSSTTGRNQGGIFLGFDDDDAALERILALSILENASASRGQGAPGGGGTKAATASRDEGEGAVESRANEPATLNTSTDISRASGGGVELGMTGERQQHLRNTIYNMFTGTAAAPTSQMTGSSVGKAATSSSSTSTAASAAATSAAGAAGKGSASAQGGGGKAVVASEAQPAGEGATTSPANAKGGNMEAMGAEIVHDAGDDENSLGVPCTMCTLLNSPTLRFCAACHHTLPVAGGNK